MSKKDKRMTIPQVMREIHHAYDFFEEAAKETLKQEFGFGEVRWQRFVEKFSEVSAQKCIEIEASMRRRLRR